MQNPKLTQVRAIGNSLGVVLPAPVIRAYKLKRGDVLAFSLNSEKKIILLKQDKLF